MTESKRCPICEGALNFDYEIHVFRCNKCGATVPRKYLNTRPIEDELEAQIAQLTAEIDRLTAENSALLEQTVIIQFENEDELPSDIQDDVYRAMFNCSHVDGVRLFPYIEENGQKYFLVMLKEDE